METPSMEAIEQLRRQVDAPGRDGGRRMVIPLTDEAEHFLASRGFEWNETGEVMVRAREVSK